MTGMDLDQSVGASLRDIGVPLAESHSRPTTSLADRLRGFTATEAQVWVPLVPILALAGFLNAYALSREGYGNAYYAAAVKSMLESWHNFFFVSFDPGGFVTVDKPPLGFWIQTASAALFGFHGWSLILPEAVAGVLSVALLYYLVRRVFGQVAGLLAALVLAITPVAVVANRSNIVDSLLVLSLLLATWAVIHAAETRRLRWLVVGMVLVGLGFNIKMLQAFLVVPALYVLYLLAARLRWRTRIWHLGLASIVLLVVSLSWATAVDLTPASQRPYVGSSQNNSEYNLIFGYNGIERLLPRNWSILGIHGFGFGPGSSTRTSGSRGQASARPVTSSTNAGGPGGVGENGEPGPLRLLDQQLGSQAGWLLPLALIGLVALAWQTRPRLSRDRRQQALLLWGTWLLTAADFFSVAGFFHSYYLVMLAPPIAALVGAGLVTLWRDYRRPGWRGWLLPLALLGVAVVQTRLLAPYPSWSHWLTPTIVIVGTAAALVLVVVRLLPLLRIRRPQVALAAVLFGMLGLMLAPAAWAAETTLTGGGGLTPVAGPQAQRSGGVGFAGFYPPAGVRGDFTPPSSAQARFASSGAARDGGAQVDTALVQYLLKQQGSTRYLVAVPSSMTAAPIILSTGKPVMALGGFSGTDSILTTSQLATLVSNDTVRFFLLSGGPGFGDGTSDLASWVTGNCTIVPSSTWQTSGSGQSAQTGRGFGGGQQLYDCAPAVRHS